MAKRSKKKKGNLWQQLPNEKKLDILGWLLFSLAMLTILSMVSAEQGILTQWWISMLSRGFGWGRYLVPIFLGAMGLWLVLRRFEDRIPSLDPEQIVGIILGFFVTEATLHLIVTWIQTDAERFALARQGVGGGYLGAVLLDVGIRMLGMAGVVFSLILSWIVVIAFTASVSPAEAIAWLLKQREAIRQRRQSHQGMRQTSKPSDPAPKPAIIGGADAEEVEPEPEPAASPPKAREKREPEINVASRPNDGGGEIQITPPMVGEQSWRLPVVNEMLEEGSEQYYSEDLMRRQVKIIEETLESFGAPVQVNEINQGPVVTQFGIEPGFITTRSGKTTKVKVSKIANLADDIALALSAKSVRVQAPIPGKGLVGIEVPNEEPTVVSLRDVMDSRSFATLEGRLRLGLGQDVSGQAVAADLRAMPHLLIAGATGSGKSVCINATIAALLLQNSPDTLRMIMVDPKRVELTQYNGIPHLLTPVIAEVDRVVPTLEWVTKEMDSRYRRFSKAGARHIEDYNRRVKDQEDARIPYIAVLIDELADVMMQAADEAERLICRIAQMARATGIHLIIATQRPSVDVVTGLIKANFPARIAFAVASSVDSRVILDMPGAERLLGQGDMLFMPPDAGQPLRLQGSFVSDRELNRIINFWRQAVDPEYVKKVEALSEGGPKVEELASQPSLFPTFDQPTSDTIEFEDELLPSSVEVFLSEDRASISLLQRRLRIGYTRAARLFEDLSELGVVADDMKGQSHKVNRAVAEKLLNSIDYEPEEAY